MANATLPQPNDAPIQAQGSGVAPTTTPRAIPVTPTLQRLGVVIVVLGVAGLVGAGVLEFFRAPEAGDGQLPACALLLLVFGLTLCFPTLLQDGTSNDAGTPNVSTMRVAVLAVVAVFALVTVKVAWTTTSLGDLKINASWAWVLAAALGSKAAQSFAEGGPK